MNKHQNSREHPNFHREYNLCQNIGRHGPQKNLLSQYTEKSAKLYRRTKPGSEGIEQCTV